VSNTPKSIFGVREVLAIVYGSGRISHAQDAGTSKMTLQ